MDEMVPFGGRDYFLMLALLAFARGMDFLSTWIATPNLVLEGNPLAKKLGWKWGLALNVVLGVALAGLVMAAINGKTAQKRRKGFVTADFTRFISLVDGFR